VIVVSCQISFFQLYDGENKLHSMKWWWYLLCTSPWQHA